MVDTLPNNEIINTPTNETVPVRRRSAWSFLLVIALAGFLALSVLFHLFLFMARMASGVSEQIKFYEQSVSGQGADKVLRLSLDGVISSGREDFSPVIRDMTVVEMLTQAVDDPEVKGIILEVNSPGGEVTASDIIAHKIKAVSASGKKVYVLMGNICASGGVYMSVFADKIFAHPTTLTGSIGVILNSINIEELLLKIGVKDRTFKSGEMKDMLSMTRELSPEERRLIQDMLKQSHERFIELIAQGRKIEPDAVRAFADGRIFGAKQAMDYKLVDAVGYFDDALDDLKKVANLGEVRVVTYKKPFSFMAFTESKLSVSDPWLAVIGWWTQPRMLAIWNP